jgi:lipopolysaccharide/colanic/teichoic acid biosynthesis glycosyltransferase
MKTKIALISSDSSVADEIRDALSASYQIDAFKNGFELHQAMETKASYKAIISDDALTGANGVLLHKTLVGYGYAGIPFIMLLNRLDAEQRQLAMKENIAEIFSKPIDKDAIGLRVDYLIENFNTPSAGYAQTAKFKLPLIKRIFDVTFSGLALIMLSPLFAIIALLIRLESKGPIFYYSLRVGSGYKVFKFYKFRSMITGADARLKDLSHLNQYNTAKPAPAAASESVKELCEFCEQSGRGCANPLYADNKVVCESLHKLRKTTNSGSAFVKIANDPRITKLGHFIRNMSIDELPQLWNVFIGDMSIVGNRPLPLYEAEKITTDKYSLRFMAPAGITGLWQVEKRGKGDMSESERLLLDNKYAKTHSFRNDIKLIMRTIPALFQSENV